MPSVTTKKLKRVRLDLEERIETLSTRLKKAKSRIMQLEIEQKSVDDKIKAEITDFMERKIKRTALKATGSMMDEIQEKIMTKATQRLFDHFEKMAHAIMKSHIEKKVKWKMKKFIGNEVEINKILALYDKGWKVAFYGKLNGEEEILLMEKPVAMENEDAKPKRSPRLER